MSDKDYEFDDDAIDIRPGPFEARTTGMDRFLAAGKTLVVFGIGIWLAMTLLLQISVGGRPWRQRNRAAVLVAVPMGLLLAARRFTVQYYVLRASDERIELRNALGQVSLDPLEVQGLIGAGGMALSMTESVVWRYVVLLARGKRYVVSFDPETNHSCYGQLRSFCQHAWCIPFDGKLETPLAGAELDPEEYIDALRQVHSYYWLHTFSTVFNGVLMLVGGGVALYVVANGKLNLRRAGKLYLWLGVIAFLGLLLLLRAARQVPVLSSIKRAERGLREAL